MRIFLSLNQNRVGAKSVLDETVLGDVLLYYLVCNVAAQVNPKDGLILKME